jgi:hypothetical protein
MGKSNADLEKEVSSLSAKLKELEGKYNQEADKAIKAETALSELQAKHNDLLSDSSKSEVDIKTLNDQIRVLEDKISRMKEAGAMSQPVSPGELAMLTIMMLGHTKNSLGIYTGNEAEFNLQTVKAIPMAARGVHELLKVLQEGVDSQV